MRHLAFHARLIELALQAENAAGCFPDRGAQASGRCQSAGHAPLRRAFAMAHTNAFPHRNATPDRHRVC